MTKLNTPLEIKEIGQAFDVLDAKGTHVFRINKNFADKQMIDDARELVRRANAYDELVTRLSNISNYFKARNLGQNAEDIQKDLQKLLTKLTDEEK